MATFTPSPTQPSPTQLALSTYPIEKLLHLWRLEELTSEQAIGHLLQHVAMLTAHGQAMQQQVQRLQQGKS